MLGEKIKAIRTYKNFGQGDLAYMLGVTVEDVRDWEDGTSTPEIDCLIRISEIFRVSLDLICRENPDNGDIDGEVFPTYEKLGEWELWSKSLEVEYRQCIDEGKEIECYAQIFNAISALPATDEKEKMADALYSLVQKTKIKKDYPYFEPNGLDMIRASRVEYPITLKARNKEDQMLGGWYGRICGCLLGKPVEGIHSDELRTLCELSGNYPLHRYIDAEDITDEIQSKIGFNVKSRAFSRDFGAMPADDDTNYMIVALEVLKRYGRNFNAEYVGAVWTDTLPKNAFCTAERVAFNNYSKGFSPPDTGSYKNAYREWIGAQIRGDVFGYVNPCDTEAAASMAWNDARLSHVKNGIYGEMWVSAMIAAAYGAESLLDAVRAGMAEIPATSRLYSALKHICDRFENGVSEEECFADISSRWNEKNGYDWCHTISNAEIVAASLLYGNGDYGKSICMAVSRGFDTDCNGATVGSVLGVYMGYEKLPKDWTDRINDTLCTALVGYSRVSVREVAKEAMKFIEK